MANELTVQHGLIINSDDIGNSSVITFDDQTGGQIGELVFHHDIDAFTLIVDGVAQLQISKLATVIAGDLTVFGDLVTVNATNLEITDNIILLNSGEGGAGVLNGVGKAGIQVDRGSLDDAGWFFNDSLGKQWWGPTGPLGSIEPGVGATQKIGNIAVIDSTDSPQEILTMLSGGAFVPPASSTVDRDLTITVPSAGMTRYNTDLASLEVYDGTDWAKIAASSSGSPVIIAGDIDLTNTFKLLNPLNPTTGDEVGDRDYNDARYLLESNDLSDVANAATARTNLAITPANIGAVDITGDTMTGDLIMEADILPDVDFITTPRDIGKTNGVDGAGADLRFRAVHAETFHGTATNALYADLAERYEADREYEPGTVVIFGGEAEVTITTTYADTRVAGVVSTKPAFKMNSNAGFSDTHPYIALKGKVPCKITGPVKKGDLIMTSKIAGYGTAVKYGPTKPYTAFARANEDSDKGMGVINVSII